MTKNKWTRGPWKVVVEQNSGGAYEWPVIEAEDRCIVGTEGFYSDIETDMANATLCASAPELYAALEQENALYERLIAMVSGGADISDADLAMNINAVMAMAETALAKARGEQ